MTGAKEPGPRGERAISRNTIAWGMPDVSCASAVNTRVHTPTTKRTRGCGCIGHPAYPAPSDLQMAAIVSQNSDASCREIAEVRSLVSLAPPLRGKGGVRGSLHAACSRREPLTRNSLRDF